MTHVQFTIAAWPQTHLQVRKGNYAVPEQNALVYDGTLTSANPVTIDADGESLYYRRDNDPGNPDGTFTGWDDHVTYPGNEQTDIVSVDLM